jgi:hypothetical protein
LCIAKLALASATGRLVISMQISQCSAATDPIIPRDIVSHGSGLRKLMALRNKLVGSKKVIIDVERTRKQLWRHEEDTISPMEVQQSSVLLFCLSLRFRWFLFDDVRRL